MCHSLLLSFFFSFIAAVVIVIFPFFIEFHRTSTREFYINAMTLSYSFPRISTYLIFFSFFIHIEIVLWWSTKEHRPRQNIFFTESKWQKLKKIKKREERIGQKKIIGSHVNVFAFVVEIVRRKLAKYTWSEYQPIQKNEKSIQTSHWRARLFIFLSLFLVDFFFSIRIQLSNFLVSNTTEPNTTFLLSVSYRLTSSYIFLPSFIWNSQFYSLLRAGGV